MLIYVWWYLPRVAANLSPSPLRYLAGQVEIGQVLGQVRLRAWPDLTVLNQVRLSPRPDLIVSGQVTGLTWPGTWTGQIRSPIPIISVVTGGAFKDYCEVKGFHSFERRRSSSSSQIYIYATHYISDFCVQSRNTIARYWTWTVIVIADTDCEWKCSCGCEVKGDKFLYSMIYKVFCNFFFDFWFAWYRLKEQLIRQFFFKNWPRYDYLKFRIRISKSIFNLIRASSVIWEI